MTASQNHRIAFLVFLVSVISLFSGSIILAADDLPTFTEDDFTVCDFGPGMEYDYSTSEINQELGVTFTEVVFGEYYTTENYIHYTINYYRDSDAAAAEYEKIRNGYVNIMIPNIQNGGWDGNAKLLLEEEGANEIGFLHYGSNYNTDYFLYCGLYCLLFDQQYVATCDICGPVEKMTEQQLRNYYSQAKDCIKKVLNKKDSKLWGKVTSAFGKELPGLVVKFSYDGKGYETTTDDTGTYRIPFEGTFGKKAQLSFLMQCYDDEAGKVLFTINTDHSNDAPYQFDQNFTVKDENDLQHDFVAMNDMQGSEFMGYVYYKLIEAIAVCVQEFGEEEFLSRIQEVIVRPYAANRHSAYQEETNSIVISDRDTVFTDYVGIFRPPELEFHEYSHHVMKSYYGELPPAPADAFVEETNHGGYINPSTADSFVEGFAIFMAQIIREKAGYKNPGVDYMFGSLDVNTRAWDGCGYSEDTAVAGIFWDLYDGTDAADEDTVQFTLQEMWGVLKNSKTNMHKVYQKFVNDFPDKKPGIDQIFINHGFFADTDRGNETYDQGEPLRGSIPNNDYYYVDLANPIVWDNKKRDGQELNEKETIGQATNYQRHDRYYPPPRPFEFIKTNDTYPFYNVTVSFSKKPGLNYELITELQEDRLIPVAIPPDTYQATITIEGYGEGVTTGAPLTFTNQEFISSYGTTIEQGYYIEHDFKIDGTAPPRPVTDPGLTNPDGNKCVASKLLGKHDNRLDTLRRFRDEVLVKSTLGKQLVKIYYEKSRTVTEALESHEFCRKIAAALLNKIIQVIEMTLT